jgi:DNA-binding PadR family transcriptional regulator|tara:strand:+ start:628 stop:855 length:228 start_codon:yes stop_codon:yes gene_type:complete
MGNSDNRSIDRLDGLKYIYDLQINKEEVSSVKLMKIKSYVLDWLEDKGFIFWNDSKTKVSITEKGMQELKDRKWL